MYTSKNASHQQEESQSLLDVHREKLVRHKTLEIDGTTVDYIQNINCLLLEVLIVLLCLVENT